MPKLPKGMFKRKGRSGWYMRLFRNGGERWVSLGADYAHVRVDVDVSFVVCDSHVCCCRGAAKWRHQHQEVEID